MFADLAGGALTGLITGIAGAASVLNLSGELLQGEQPPFFVPSFFDCAIQKLNLLPTLGLSNLK